MENKTPLHRLALYGLMALCALVILAIVALLLAGIDGNAVAVLSALAAMLLDQLARVGRHLFPAPEYEADPAKVRKS